MVTFAWPWMLAGARGRPARRALVPAVAARPRGPPRRAGRARPGRPGARRPAAPRCRPRCCSAPSRCCCSALARPEIGVPLPAPGGHRDAGVRRVVEHDRDRPRPDADGRREGRGAHRRRAPTAHRAGGRRRVRQQRARHPAADRGPGERARRDRPPPAGRGHGAGQRPADLAERDHREDGAGRRAGHGRPASSRRGRTSATTAPRPSSCSPTARTRPSRTRSRSPISRPARACGSTRSGSASPRGTVIEVDGFQLATALDEPMLRDDRRARTDGRYVAAADAAALAGVADAIDLEWKVETEHIEVTGLLAAAAAVLVLAGVGLSLLWFGRAVCELSPGRSRCCRCSPCRCWPAAYVWQLRRRRRRAVRYSSVALIRAAAPPRSAWRRHVAVRAAPGRPRRARGGRGPAPMCVDVPVSESAVILALDVSGSMCATDVEPNRLTAAQAAVRDFVRGPGRPTPASGSCCSPGSPRSPSRRRRTGRRCCRRSTP